MATGYFAGQLAYFYRDTADGQRVTARRILPLLPPRWMLVTPDAQPRFERRFKQGHVAAMLAFVLGMQLVGDEPALTTLFAVAFTIGLVAFPLAQWWATAGLPVYVGAVPPVRRRELYERQARAMGPATIAGFVLISIVLTLPALAVAVIDGVWWAWLGVGMFGGSAVFFVRMLVKVRNDDPSARAT
jgi:hypothetical protein